MGSSTLSQADIDALVAGRHHDVFSLLGLHANPAGPGLVIRAFVPGVQNIEVIGDNGKKIAALEALHPAGLFEKVLSRRKNRFGYRLRLNGADVIEDVYRFPSQLQAEDLYLFAEGGAEHAYRWMGAHAAQIDGVDGVSFVVWAPSAKRVYISIRATASRAIRTSVRHSR